MTRRGPGKRLAQSAAGAVGWQRKLLSHTLAVYLCQQTGLGSLRFADLLGP